MLPTLVMGALAIAAFWTAFSMDDFDEPVSSSNL